MALGKRLISTGGVAVCTTDTADVFGDSSGVALYNLDYDASDASGNYDGTPTDVEFGVGGQINYGARFNGSSSRIAIPNVIDFATGEHTISAWVNFTDTSTSRFISNLYSGTVPDGSIDFVWIPSSNSINIDFSIGGSNYTNTITSVNSNEWIHIVATFVNNGTCTAYKNGTSIDTVTAASFTATTYQDLNLGYYARGNDYWSGSIDQVRIFSKALSSDEVDTLWNSGNGEIPCEYTCTTDTVNYPSGTTPVAYYKLDNSSEDYSTGGNDGTDTDIEYRFGRFGQAAVFNGSTSYIESGISTDIFNSDYTISFWGKVSNSGYNTFINTYNGSSVQFVRCDFSLNTGYLNFYHRNASNTAYSNATLAANMNDGNWHHIVITKDNTNVKVYKDSSLVGTITSTSGTYNNSTTLQIGRNRYNTDGVNTFNGDIDQVRIYSTALTSSQVTELYEEKPCADTSNFKTVLYEGNGTTNYISNVGMDLETDGGLVWVKSRDTAYHHRLVDSVRGLSTDGVLFSNRTNAAEDLPSATDNFTSFDKNGFTLGSTSSTNGSNFNGDSFVAWVWKGGGDAVSNTDGTATNVQVSNNDKGFSIVTMDADTGVRTVGHGLTVDGVDTAPELIIWKSLTSSTNYWQVLAQAANSGNGHLGRLALQRSDAFLTVSSVWNDTQPTSTVFTLGTSCTDKGVAYCFASVSGVSKIGSYSGTGVNGNRVYLDSNGDGTGTGAFEPRWLLVKRTNVADNWVIVDSERGLNNSLFPDDSSQELNNSGAVSFNTDGFTVNGNSGGWNNGTSTYIYMAFK